MRAGAGWGGCIVALVPEAQLQPFMQQLQQHYYMPAMQSGLLSPGEEVLGRYCFASHPGPGAKLMEVRGAGTEGYKPPWEL